MKHKLPQKFINLPDRPPHVTDYLENRYSMVPRYFNCLVVEGGDSPIT